jgi:adenosylcobalamin-dependent ribonucleoside-triphosphate reductase
VNGLVEIGGLFTDQELERLYDLMFNLRGLASGRALWQLGTSTVQRVGADSLCNCWFVAADDLEAFCFTFNQLMLGGGVGVSCLPEHVYALPPVRHRPTIKRVSSYDCDFIIPDNREGWVETLRRVLRAFFVTGKPFTYSTRCIRDAGLRIEGFGGTASGPEPLVRGIEQICNILRSRVGQKLRPIDVVDIMNIIGSVVVAGNVRRSSEIALGDPGDRLFLEAKNWKTHPIPNWRVMSNNSVVCDSIDDLRPDFWQGYQGNGEPYGLVNLRNCRRFARLVDGPDYRPDYGIVGVNPCGEANLWNKEPCNLGELILPNIADVDELISTATLLYQAAKAISCAPYSDSETQRAVAENRRIGLGLTGWMAAAWFHSAPILNRVYRALEAADERYSRAIGCNRSKRLTTMKPSGTLSLLPFGVTPGMHAAFARYLIRRIRFSGIDPLVEVCRRHGYHVEPQRRLDGSEDAETMVVEFPVDMGPNAVTEDQITVTDQLETQKFLQTYWADQSISCTHYYKPEELPLIRRWLQENYESSVKTCAFLLGEGHGFAQAPLEKITEEQYHKLRSQSRPITQITDHQQIDHLDNLECAGGHCPVK